MIFESEKDDAFSFTPLAGFHPSQIFQIKTLLNQTHFASEYHKFITVYEEINTV